MMIKRCACCGQPFEPRPQVPDQAFCSSTDCQRARRRQWQRDKLKSDPDYRSNQQDAQRAWTQRNQDHWRTRREFSIGSGQPDPKQPEQSDARQPPVAKMDVSTLPSGIYRITRHPAFPREDGDSCVVEITLLCATCPCQLWQLKTGRAQPEPPNAAMAWGTRMEPQARAAYEERTGLVMEPLVLVDGEYSASLDGLTLDGKLLLEVKAPAKQKASALWAAVSAGEIPEHYRWQLEHQLLVSGAELAHLWVWTEDEAILLEHAPDPDCFTILRDSWDAFMKCVASDTPPPLTDADTVIRTDEAWVEAAQSYTALSAQADEVGDKLVEAKKRLLALARHSSERGAGVAVSTFWRTGTVDYKRLVQMLKIDPEPFRGPARQETRISFVKA